MSTLPLTTCAADFEISKAVASARGVSNENGKIEKKKKKKKKTSHSRVAGTLTKRSDKVAVRVDHLKVPLVFNVPHSDGLEEGQKRQGGG